jgi:hypothetical protein
MMNTLNKGFFIKLFLASFFLSFAAFAQPFKPLFKQAIPYKGNEVKMVAAWKNECGTMKCYLEMKRQCQKVSQKVSNSWDLVGRLDSHAKFTADYEVVYHGPAVGDYAHLRRVVCIATFKLESEDYQLYHDRQRVRGEAKLKAFIEKTLTADETIFYTLGQLESFWGRRTGRVMNSVYYLKLEKK